MNKFVRKIKVKPGRPNKATDKQILEAIKQCAGFLSQAAEKLGMKYQGMRRRIKTSKELQRAVDAIQEEKLDFSESQLEKQIKKGNLTAIIFHLKCKGKQRGYVERVDSYISSPKNKPLNIQVKQEEALRKLSVAELETLEAIIEKMEGRTDISGSNRGTSVNIPLNNNN